ncbi:hypothetical protein RDI58_010773 [Solanum bulbocastanum]|uniref:Uncharacterized protein n=1 Tax=Solanum bulbocastanum TaxID=147425 RepID=A0AAN8TV67_SOLBU
MNVEEEISENVENESFDDEEWDYNENETIEKEEWENDGIETKRINHDTHLFVVPFGMADPRAYYPNYRPVDASSTSQALPSRRYEDLLLQAIRRPRPLSTGRVSDGTPSPTGTSPQLSAIRIRDFSSEQSDVMASTPPLTQRFMHPDVSPSSTAAPSATPDDEMPALAPG